jgi:hypothetical protein
MSMSTPYTVTASGVYGPVPAAGGYVRISGISLRETSGSAGATIVFHEGGVVGGRIIGSFQLAQGTSFGPDHMPDVRCQGQLYIAITGAVEGAVYLR